MDPSKLAHEWEAQGRRVTVLGNEVFVIDTAAVHLPVIVILHGYPSSSFDYCHVIPLLKDSFRIIVHDHTGFGLSDKPEDYSYSLFEQTDVALKLWQELGVKHAHLIAHDYGTSVATEILARKASNELEINLDSVTLCNGSIHLEMANLRWIQKLLRHKFWGPLVAKFGNQAIYVHQMRRLWSDRRKCDVKELKAMWIMNSSRNGRKVLPKITQYLRERVEHRHRWISALNALDVPAHILWAQNDPVSVSAIGEQLHLDTPNSVITRMADLGHYPMLEDAKGWTENVRGFLESLINAE